MRACVRAHVRVRVRVGMCGRFVNSCVFMFGICKQLSVYVWDLHTGRTKFLAVKSNILPAEEVGSFSWQHI